MLAEERERGKMGAMIGRRWELMVTIGGSLGHTMIMGDDGQVR